MAGFSRQGAAVAVALDDGSQLDADLVLVATGLRPRGVGRSSRTADRIGGHPCRPEAQCCSGVHALGDVACVDGVNAMYVQPLQASAKALARTARHAHRGGLRCLAGHGQDAVAAGGGTAAGCGAGALAARWRR
ncbi:hypothetical protein DSL92_06925 [Billgrantia gudaonensis]|uniref:FAD/NAD(P)-binding domain-containing protein n=1 Tax=Billgrantia gudaonensis TaxID=376427 RepID=A0A432JH70_9GAMM|nr:hypothetical protein DSL92_06925 [Halomonas gudaonensis]